MNDSLSLKQMQEDFENKAKALELSITNLDLNRKNNNVSLIIALKEKSEKLVESLSLLITNIQRIFSISPANQQIEYKSIIKEDIRKFTTLKKDFDTQNSIIENILRFSLSNSKSTGRRLSNNPLENPKNITKSNSKDKKNSYNNKDSPNRDKVNLSNQNVNIQNEINQINSNLNTTANLNLSQNNIAIKNDKNNILRHQSDLAISFGGNDDMYFKIGNANDNNDLDSRKTTCSYVSLSSNISSGSNLDYRNGKKQKSNKKNLENISLNKLEILDKTAKEACMNYQNFLVTLEADVKSKPLLFANTDRELNDYLTMRDSWFYFYKHPPKLKVAVLLFLVLLAVVIYLIVTWN